MSNNDPHRPSAGRPPQHGKLAQYKQAWIVVGITGAFCILLLALLFSLSDRKPIQQTVEQSQEVVALLEAPSLLDVEIVDADSFDVGVALPSGGWIQQTDGQGKLSQQYRCTSLDPSPANLPVGWIEMTDPDVELFLADDRVLRITGDTAIANAPKRALVSGDIYGNVRIELFEGALINTTTDTPTIVMTTPQANFDNFLGEVTCDSEVRIVSNNHSSLTGRKLALRFNDANGRIEYLRMEEVDEIKLYPERMKTRISEEPSARTGSAHAHVHHNVAAAAIETHEQYYLLTLSKGVIVKQGDTITGKEARGDRMTIAFAFNSSIDSRMSRQTVPSNNITLGKYSSFIASMLGTSSDLPAANQLTSLQTPLLQDSIPVVITCEDGLTMLPIDEIALMPSLPEETRLEIFGTPAKIVDHSSNMSAKGERIRYEVQQDRMDLHGSPALVELPDVSTHANHLWIAQQTGEGKIIGEGKIVQRAHAGVDTTITWDGGVDFTLTPMAEDSDDSGGVLEQVVCKGNIEMKTDESNLTCDVLDIRFVPDETGSSSPQLAIATGNVKATSDTQILWADIAQVTFVEDSTASNSSSEFGDNFQADTMTATGDVQVMLSDGGRAFCNTLRGDIRQSIAELEGNVLIAYKRMLMDRGDDALFRINRSTGKGLWEGSGQARFLTQPLKINDNNRMKRPSVHVDSMDMHDDPDSQHVSMRTNWQDSMAIDQHFNNDAGLIDFRGEVVARSRKVAHELTEIHSENLQFEFTNDTLPDSKEPTDKRRLQRVIAREDAKFEHRLWNKEQPDALPLVYYIGGNHIEYETETSEILAVGNGELLIRDERTPLNTMHRSSIAGRGTTRFTWDGNLRTTRISESFYRIKMEDNVEMLHKGLDNTIGMLTAQTIQAISQNTIPNDTSPTESVTMRSMDVQEIQAQGNVYVSTSTRRVDCDFFDYNVRTGLARLSALQNRTVAIVTEGTPYPVRAKSILWNMDPGIDSITVKGLRGTSTN